MLHKPYRQYLLDTTPFERTFDLLWYLLHRAKESYWATPEDQRHLFLAQLTREEADKSLDQRIKESLELQRAINAKNAQAQPQNGTTATSSVA